MRDSCLSLMTPVTLKNIGNATIFGKNPLLEDCKGSVADQAVQLLSGGKILINGDEDKAMKALYRVATGEGAGAGC